MAHAIDGVVRRWNAAINAHDADTLAALYGDPVEINGKSMPRERAVAAKRTSFATHAKEELSDIHVTPSGHAQFRRKRIDSDGRATALTGFLEMRERSGTWLVDSEGDIPSDADLTRAKASRCEEAVIATVYATPEAKTALKTLDDAATSAPADDPVSRSGMVTPPGEWNSAWSVAICESHRYRLVCTYSFTMEPHTKEVMVLAPEGARLIDSDPALAAKVERACN